MKTNILIILIPVLWKKTPAKKCRKRQETRQAISELNFKNICLKETEDGEENQSEIHPKKKEPRTPNVMGVLSDLHENSDENTLCEAWSTVQ